MMGSIIKMMVLYKENFWIKKGFSGEFVSDCIDGPCFNVFDDSRPNDAGEIQPCLVVFLNGGVARSYRNQPIKELVLKKLAQVFGPEAEECQTILMQDWN